jgi:hypothetical protein
MNFSCSLISLCIMIRLDSPWSFKYEFPKKGHKTWVTRGLSRTRPPMLSILQCKAETKAQKTKCHEYAICLHSIPPPVILIIYLHVYIFCCSSVSYIILSFCLPTPSLSRPDSSLSSLHIKSIVCTSYFITLLI